MRAYITPVSVHILSRVYLFGSYLKTLPVKYPPVIRPIPLKTTKKVQ